MNRERYYVNNYPNNQASISEVYQHIYGRKGWPAFWEQLKCIPDISIHLTGRMLYRSELVYDFFLKHGFENYFRRQQLNSWEEVVNFVEERNECYLRRYESYNQRMDMIRTS